MTEVKLRDYQEKLIEDTRQAVKMKREDITREYLLSIFDYDRENGSITWKVGKRKGMKAQTRCHSGYRANIKGLMVQISHIIWMIEYGEFPKRKLTHINGDSYDARICNLKLGRRASQSRDRRITQDELKAHLTYNPETGIFQKKNGTPVGYLCKDGYIQINLLDGSQRKAHRLAWLYMTGSFPKGILDHIDGNRTNNKWENLREVSYSQNGMNSSFRKSNTSGYKGVSFDKKYQKYEAYIWKDNKKKHLGYYDCPLAANDAYMKASEVMHGEYARQ